MNSTPDQDQRPVMVITGIAKRLGYAMAEHFQQQGFQVVGSYRSLNPNLEKLARLNVEMIPCDFNDQHEIDQFIHQLTLKKRPIRAVIHNASDWLPDDCGQAANQVFHRMMTVHAGAPYQINMALADQLIQTDQQSDIIHITDCVIERGSAKHAAYAASKAALDNLTKSFASKFAPKIKVNSIAPGLLKFNDHDDETYRAKTLKKALIQKEGGFEEIINAIQFILSSDYMTGRAISLDGGRHLKTL